MNIRHKNIWIDLTDFIDWQGHFTGIQRVEYELARRLSKQDNVRFFFYSPIKTAFIETNFDQIEGKAKIASGELKISKEELDKQIRLSRRIIKRFKEAIPPKTRTRLVRLKGGLQRMGELAPYDITNPFSDNDVVFVLGGNWAFATFMPSLRKVKKKVKGLKTVHILYDLIPVMQPGFFPSAMEKSFGKYIEHVLASADLSLSISEYTKKDALLYAEAKGIICNNIIPFRLGDNFISSDSEKPKTKIVEAGSYLLAVGTLEVRKNHMLLYYAAKLANQQGKPLPKIVIVGKAGWLSETTVHLLKQDPEIKDKFVILNKCTDKEMAWLYENCLFTVYPSYYEGWGLPIAEALKYGKVCLSSDTSSMPEVGEDAIEYFSPYNPQQCLDLITKYLDSKTLKQAEATVRKNYKPTTWEDSYSQFYELVINGL